MIALAREELEHFHQVYRLIEARGIQSCDSDEKDPYLQRSRPSGSAAGAPSASWTDSILGGVVEARGCERFGLVAEALRVRRAQGPSTSTSRALRPGTRASFVPTRARLLSTRTKVDARLESLLDHEAQVVARARAFDLRCTRKGQGSLKGPM